MNFIKNKRRFLVYVLALLWSLPSFALEVQGLFEIEIVARSEAGEDRSIALKQALFAVLERIVIADDIAKIPVVQTMLHDAEHYVKQSHYSLLPADEYAETDARLFRVQFDEDQVLDVLRKNQVGIWSEIRPETLLWLVVDEGDGKQFYNPDTMPDFENALTKIAKLKGIPLIYPLLDIEEQQKVSVNDVLGIAGKNLLSASERYDVPAVMAGRMTKQGNCWLSDWQFYFDGKSKQWSSPCLPLKPAISTGIRGAYDILSNYYGVKPAPTGVAN